MVFDLFSKRQKVIRGEMPDVYIYDQLPDKLKVQITYQFDRVLESISNLSHDLENIYKIIAEILREERGVYHLFDAYESDGYYGKEWVYEKEVKNYFLGEENTEHALDVVECFFKIVHYTMENQYSYITNGQEILQKIIDNLNIRFKEHGIGYCYSNNCIMRIDSELTHNNIVKPALKLLHDKEFKNAEDEYLNAHQHYRHGRYSECLVDCLKSIETTIKIIGNNRKWRIKDTDNASKLISYLFEEKLIPDYLQSHFSALKSCLESGVPTVRNKSGGHGQGVVPISTPAYMAEYLIGEAANTIRLIIEAHNFKK